SDRSLAGHHDAVVLEHLACPLGDDDLHARALGGLDDRLRDGLQVAHAVVDHGDGGGHSDPFVDGITPSERGSSVMAMRSARPNALKIVSAWWCALWPLRLSM